MIAGEDRNDRQVLRVLLEEFCPDMRGRIVEINDTVRLRAASDTRLTERVRTLARKARARAQREQAALACVFVHEDLDGPAGEDYPRLKARVDEALRQELGSAHYVLAAAETEAWLLLFPDVLGGFASGWRVPRQYRRRDTGQLADPKRVLKAEVSSSIRRYTESDAPVIIARAAHSGHVRQQPSGTNQSWSHFCGDVRACCGQHLPRPQR